MMKLRWKQVRSLYGPATVREERLFRESLRRVFARCFGKTRNRKDTRVRRHA